jgi:hypothetical protein
MESSTGEENPPHFTTSRDSSSSSSANNHSNSSSSANNHSNNTQESSSIINIRRPVFIEELPELYASAAFADTLVRCVDGSRRVHSLVLAASSSLLRNALGHVAERSGSGGNLLPDFLILVPDLRLDQLDAVIRPLYGESLAAASIDEESVRMMARELFGVDFNNPDYRASGSHSMEHQLVKAEEKQQNSASGTVYHVKVVMRIRDILVRIRIRRSVSLANGSGSCFTCFT